MIIIVSRLVEQQQSLHGHTHRRSDTGLGVQVLEHREKQYDLRMRMDVHVCEGGAERVRSCPGHCSPLAQVQLMHTACSL